MSRVNGAVVTLPAEAAKIVLYRQRWLMLLLFCVLSALNGCMWIQFASVADLCRGYFGQSALAIDGFSMAYLITYIPGVFAANWVYDHRGLRAGLLLAAGLNAAGALLRWLGAVQAPPSFAMTMSGQLLAAMAQCLSFGAPPLLAVRFFGAGERATATTLGVLANQLGTGCGMLTATLVAEGSQLPPVLLATALAAFVILVLFAAAFRDAPPSPPSRSAAASAHAAEAGSEAEAEVASLLSADAKAVGVASSTGGSGYAAMMQNKGFVSLLLSYGAIMSACTYQALPITSYSISRDVSERLLGSRQLGQHADQRRPCASARPRSGRYGCQHHRLHTGRRRNTWRAANRGAPRAEPALPYHVPAAHRRGRARLGGLRHRDPDRRRRDPNADTSRRCIRFRINCADVS